MSAEQRIPKLELPSDRPPIFVSAGLIKTETNINLYSNIPEIAVQVIGSFSENENIPDGGGRIFYYDETAKAAYNAFRLRNPGRKAASKYLPHSIGTVHEAGQLAIVGVTSLEGEDPEKVLPELAEWALEMGADGVELNGSCPNVGEGLLCQDVNKTTDTCGAVRDRVGASAYISIKVPELAETTIRRFKQTGLPVDAVAAINAVRRMSPNDASSGRPTIEVNGGYAGQSGPAISSLAYKNLRSWLRAPSGATDFPVENPQFDVWFVGGIDSGFEVYEGVHNVGAFAAGGAQAFYKAAHPKVVARRWGKEYRAVQQATSELVDAK